MKRYINIGLDGNCGILMSAWINRQELFAEQGKRGIGTYRVIDSPGEKARTQPGKSWPVW
jgi:hypothetical protein